MLNLLKNEKEPLKQYFCSYLTHPPTPLPFSKEGGGLHCFNAINGFHLFKVNAFLSDHLKAFITLQTFKPLRLSKKTNH